MEPLWLWLGVLLSYILANRQKVKLLPRHKKRSFEHQTSMDHQAVINAPSTGMELVLIDQVVVTLANWGIFPCPVNCDPCTFWQFFWRLSAHKWALKTIYFLYPSQISFSKEKRVWLKRPSAPPLSKFASKRCKIPT